MHIFLIKGPGLLAFALFCGAFSLRMWRRNGIACDELLFLPGSPLEDERQRHGTCYQEMKKLFPCLSKLETNNDYNRLLHVASEEEELQDFDYSSTTNTSTTVPQQHGISITEQEEDKDNDMQRLVNISQEPVQDPQIDDVMHSHMASSSNGTGTTTDITPFPSWNENRSTSLTLVRNFLLCKLRQRRQTQRQQQQQDSSSVPTTTPMPEETIFDPNFTYSPSGASVLGAALDLALPVLLNFHLFIAAFSHPRYAGSNTPKIFPCKIQHLFLLFVFINKMTENYSRAFHLYFIVCFTFSLLFVIPFLVIFLTVLTVRAIFPRTKRKRFWGSILYTMCSPIFSVQFRDEIIGDVLSSLVRPIQDLVFAYVYYFTVLRYGVADAAQRCNESNNFFLHIWALPACALLPLWWRFLQCLRQSRDNNCRWPYYGNAFKYFIAAMVVLNDFGHVTNNSANGSSSDSPTLDADSDKEWYNRTWWIISFLLATLYQIWWDVFFDWELFVITPSTPITTDTDTVTTAASFDEDDSIMRSYYNYFCSIWNTYRVKYIYLPGDQVTLRPKRMYKSDELYWGIFFLNCAFRFLWILSFIPAKHFSPASGIMVNSFSSDVQSYVGPIIAGGEIIRRCMWGILRVELESIKLHNNEINDDPTQCIHRVKQRKEAIVDELEVTDDSQSDEIAFGRRPSLSLFVKCSRQLEPIAFIAIFIVCGFRALTS